MLEYISRRKIKNPDLILIDVIQNKILSSYQRISQICRMHSQGFFRQITK